MLGEGFRRMRSWNRSRSNDSCGKLEPPKVGKRTSVGIVSMFVGHGPRLLWQPFDRVREGERLRGRNEGGNANAVVPVGIPCASRWSLRACGRIGTGSVVRCL